MLSEMIKLSSMIAGRPSFKRETFGSTLRSTFKLDFYANIIRNHLKRRFRRISAYSLYDLLNAHTPSHSCTFPFIFFALQFMRQHLRSFLLKRGCVWDSMLNLI